MMDMQDAEALASELTLSRKLLGNEHPTSLATARKLAAVYAMLGMYLQAEEVELSVLGSQKRLYGEAHDSTLDTNVRLTRLYLTQVH